MISHILALSLVPTWLLPEFQQAKIRIPASFTQSGIDQNNFNRTVFISSRAASGICPPVVSEPVVTMTAPEILGYTPGNALIIADSELK